MDISQEVYGIVHQYLRKVGRSGPENVMAICPFHLKSDGSEESSPSFAMSLTSGLFFCHACQAKGNLYTFLRDIGMSRVVIEHRYRDIIDQASRNIPPPPDPMRPGVFELEPIEEALLGIFDTDYDLPGLNAFTTETLRHFDIGWDGWHNKVTFPMRDLKGKLVGISGRSVYGDQWPKYKVYEEEYKVWGYPPRYDWDKGAVLWNANELYLSAFGNNPGGFWVILVEGFKAAMWLWQCGCRNVCALLGSHLTEKQKWILERLGASVYVFLDNNEPGMRGASDAASRLSKSLRTYVMEYPERLLEDEDAQPDDLAPHEVHEQLARAPSYEQWLMNNLGEGYVIR